MSNSNDTKGHYNVCHSLGSVIKYFQSQLALARRAALGEKVAWKQGGEWHIVGETDEQPDSTIGVLYKEV